MNWKYYNPKFEYEEKFEDSAEAWTGHKYFAYDLIANIKPKIVVELGTYYGTSFWSFSQAVKDQNIETGLNAVDTWQGEKHTGFYSEEVFEIVNQIKDKYYNDLHINLLRMTFDEAVAEFKDNSIDILHIDGLHTYESVKDDFEKWLPKLGGDSIVLFHDIKVGENDFGVHIFWGELKKKYVTIEFFQSYGLGILFLNENLGKEIKNREQEWQMHYSYIYEKNKSKIIIERNIEIQTKEKELLIRKQDIQNKEESIKVKDFEIQSINKEFIQKDQELISVKNQLSTNQAQLNSKVKELSEIYACRGWRVIIFLRRILGIILPTGSLRRKVVVFYFRFCKRAILKIKHTPLYFGRSIKLLKKSVFIIKKDGVILFTKKVYHRLMHNQKNPEKNNKVITDYGSWISQNEKFDIDNIEKEIYSFKYKPLISIIVPNYNIDPKWLDKCIQSVMNQYYKNWELCIHDDASTKSSTIKSLKKWENVDPRIKVSFGKKNLYISGATNEAVNLSAGDFLALLDSDDELSPNALYENVKVLNKNQDIDFIYSDQDKIDESGVRSSPFFKPDWSPEFFRGVMYIGHLLVVRKTLAIKIGLFDKKFDKIQDYEFALRLSEITNNIFHIPKILYYWRSIPGSGAANPGAKSGIDILHEDSVNEHLKRIGIKGKAKNEGMPHRLKIYPTEQKLYPLVSIIIPTKDQGEILNKCLESIFTNTKYPAYEVILVDNNTQEKFAIEVMKKFKTRIIKYNQIFNYSEVNNIAARQANGEYLILLNNDTEVIDKDWIQKMLFYANQKDVGAVGPMLIYPDGTVQHAGVVLGFRGTADHIMRGYPNNIDGYYGSLCCAREVSAVTAACMMIRRSIFNEVGGFCHHYQSVYQDVDLCLKIREKKYRIIYTPTVKLIHHESKSRGNDYNYLDRLLLLDLWGHTIKRGDPYYNINFDTNKYSSNNTGYNI